MWGLEGQVRRATTRMALQMHQQMLVCSMHATAAQLRNGSLPGAQHPPLGVDEVPRLLVQVAVQGHHLRSGEAWRNSSNT